MDKIRNLFFEITEMVLGLKRAASRLAESCEEVLRIKLHLVFCPRWMDKYLWERIQVFGLGMICWVCGRRRSSTQRVSGTSFDDWRDDFCCLCTLAQRRDQLLALGHACRQQRICQQLHRKEWTCDLSTHTLATQAPPSWTDRWATSQPNSESDAPGKATRLQEWPWDQAVWIHNLGTDCSSLAACEPLIWLKDQYVKFCVTQQRAFCRPRGCHEPKSGLRGSAQWNVRGTKERLIGGGYQSSNFEADLKRDSFQCVPTDHWNRHQSLATSRTVVWNWSGSDMTIAFCCFLLEPFWYSFQAINKIVAGSVAAAFDLSPANQLEVYPALRVMPMGWKSACGLLQYFHPRLCFRHRPRDMPLPRTMDKSRQDFFMVYLDGFCGQYTHTHAHTAQYTLFTSAERIASAWLEAQVTRIAVSSLCAWKGSVIWSARSHLLLLTHLPRTTSTSSSSFTTTSEHAPQSAQHDLLQEHPVHHQPLQAVLVDSVAIKKNPLWRENLQSDGNLRNTISTGYEPKELATKEIATVSRISRITDPCQLYDGQKEFGEEDHGAPITKEVKECGEIGTHSLPDYPCNDSTISETSYFHSHMHFDDSAKIISDSDLEDGELQKMPTSPLCALKASGKPDAMVMQEREKEREVHNTLKPIEREVWGLIQMKVRKLWGNPMHCSHLSRETWSGVLCSETIIRRIWEDLFLKETRMTCSVRWDQTWRSKSFMSRPSTSTSVNYEDKRKNKDWRYRTHNTDLLNLDENKFDCKKNCLWKKRFSEKLKSEICTKWEKLRELKNNEQMRSECKS